MSPSTALILAVVIMLLWLHTTQSGAYVARTTRQSAGVILALHTRNTSLTHQPPPLVLLGGVMIDDRDPVYSRLCWHQRYGNTTEKQNSQN